MQDLFQLGARVGERLKARQETVAVMESSSGGLVSAALLSAPGASAYYLGGGVVYTGRAVRRLLDFTADDLRGVRSSSEPYAALLAERARSRFRTDWGVSETGAAGPTGNPYGDAAGHSCFAVAGPVSSVRTLETGEADRTSNMQAFASAALMLLLEALDA